jgi:hypothetical protein
MTPELHEVIEDAYRIFATYRPGTQITCQDDNRIPADAERALLTTPLRSISRHLLAQYTKHACECYWGEPEDSSWPYYLPRYFELVAWYQWPSNGAYDALKCLRPLGPHNFQALDERAVVSRFAPAFLRQCITEPIRSIDVDLEISYTYSEHASPMQIWDMFDVGFDLWGLLKVWEGADGVTPALHLASSINNYFGCGNYLQSIPPQFASWLRLPSVWSRIQRAILETRDPLELAMVRKAGEHLRNLHIALRAPLRI